MLHIREMLGMVRVHQDAWGDCPIVMAIGTTAIALFPARGAHPNPPPGRDARAMRHIAFRADGANFTRALATLKARGVSFECQDHAIAQSIYFVDPDGYQIEITTYDLSHRQLSGGER